MELKPAETRSSLKKSIVFMAGGLVAFMLYLYFFVGFGEISAVVKRVNPVEYFLYYFLTIIAIVLSSLFYSLVWRELLKTLSLEITVKNAFFYCWLGNFVDLILPLETVTGELTRLYLVHNDFKDHLGKTVASLVYHRIISVFTTLSILMVSSAFLILEYKVETSVLYLLLTITAGTAATVIILLYISVKEEATEKLVSVLVRLARIVIKNQEKLADISEKAKRTLFMFHQSVKTLGKNPACLVKPFIYSYTSWFFHLIVYFLGFYTLGFSQVANYSSQIAILFSITLAIQTIPIGFPIGLVEGVMTYLGNLLFQVDLATSSLAALMIRSVTFWFQILVGYLIAQWMGLTQLLRRNLTQKMNFSENRVSQ